MTSVILSLCSSCKRKTGNNTCLSFMEGIPDDILFGLADHRQSIGNEPPYDPDPARIDLFAMWVRGYEDSLTAAVLVPDTDTYYNPGQPRDQRGRWMDAPGGMVPNVMPGGGLEPMPPDVAGTEARLLAGEEAECNQKLIDPLLRDLAHRPSTNLARLQVEGEPNMYTKHEREIPRDDMPQLPENVEGLAAFRKALDGTKAEVKVVDPRDLHMTQNQLDSAKVGFLYNAIKEGGWRKDSLLFVSRDGDILDGHHRWAAAAAARVSGTDIKINVLQVDLPIDELLKVAETVSLAHKSMAQGFAARGRHSFDEDQPSSPPPNLYEPWFWFDGKWWLVVTDGGDEVPQTLTFPEEESLQASGEAFKYNPSQPRVPRGQRGGGRFAKGHLLAASGRYEDLSDKGRAAVDRNMEQRGLTKEALDAEIESMLTPENLATGKEWYPNARKFNEDLAKKAGVSVEVATAMTAALSPRLGWAENKKRVAVLAEKLKEFPPDMPAAEVAKRVGGSIPQFLTDAVACTRPGADVNEIIGGTKRRSFYNNMLSPGGTDDVTVDRWTMEVGVRAVKTGTQTIETNFVDPDVMAWLKASETTTGGGAGYLSISDAFRRVAERHDTTPDAIQAAYWEAVRGGRD